LIDQEAEWKKLEIVGARKGGREDNEGQVDFIAHYIKDGTPQTLSESSRFYKVNGRWVYSRKDSTLPPVPAAPLKKPKTFIRGEAKVGRNDLCPCGSGKKYKKCCAS
jgi:SEC-C motif-containing protein